MVAVGVAVAVVVVVVVVVAVAVAVVVGVAVVKEKTMNNENERGPNGERESNFRRDVRQILDMHPLDRDDVIVAEVKRLKALETREYKAGKA